MLAVTSMDSVASTRTFVRPASHQREHRGRLQLVATAVFPTAGQRLLHRDPHRSSSAWVTLKLSITKGQSCEYIMLDVILSNLPVQALSQHATLRHTVYL